MQAAEGRSGQSSAAAAARVAATSDLRVRVPDRAGTAEVVELALVAQQVALHGGSVEVDDGTRGGARITVTLPRRRVRGARRSGTSRGTAGSWRHAVTDHTADYSKHTDQELREGIARVDEQESRIAQDSSEDALDAARDQRAQMAEELARREGGTTSPTTGSTR